VPNFTLNSGTTAEKLANTIRGLLFLPHPVETQHENGCFDSRSWIHAVQIPHRSGRWLFKHGRCLEPEIGRILHIRAKSIYAGSSGINMRWILETDAAGFVQRSISWLWVPRGRIVVVVVWLIVVALCNTYHNILDLHQILLQNFTFFANLSLSLNCSDW